jgi:outer membrane protein assembly factor BamB
LPISAFSQAETVWRGTQRDGKYDGKGLLDKWPEKGPKVLFTVENMGDGFSSPAVTSDRIYVTGMVADMGYLFALDMQGKTVWKTAYGKEWNSDHPGVRGTPTVAGKLVYVESGQSRVVCLNTADGKEVWAVDMVKEFGAQIPQWGHAENLLLNGNQLICTPGGTKATVAALDAATGKTLWTSPGDKQISGYCSPVLINHGANALLVTMLAKSIIALDPASGALLWQITHETEYGVNPNTPLYSNGNILYFSGYGQGAGMLKLSADGKKVTPVWKEPRFDIQIGGAILIDNFLYGSGHKNKGWHCLDITTGKIVYTMKDIGGGCVISAGGLLYCYSEKGTMSLVKPGSRNFTVVSSFEISQGTGPHWAHPVIKDGKLFLRHGNVLMVYSIGI